MDQKWLKLKQALQQQKQGLEQTLANQINDHNTGELSQYDNHPADTATDLFEREKDQAVHNHIKDELHEVEHALAKFNDGTYGICEKTGKAIPYERLEAYPTARTVVKESRPFEEYRPVEEDVLKGFEAYNNDDQDATFFDGEDAYQSVARFHDTSPEYDEETGDTDTYGANGVEAYEGFLSTGIDGYHGPDSIHIERNDHYKRYRRD